MKYCKIVVNIKRTIHLPVAVADVDAVDDDTVDDVVVSTLLSFYLVHCS